MKVLLFAAIRDAADGAREVHVDATTVPALVAELADRYGEVMARRLEVASVMVDGTKVARDDDTVRLLEADEVAVVPPFAGGATAD